VQIGNFLSELVPLNITPLASTGRWVEPPVVRGQGFYGGDASEPFRGGPHQTEEAGEG
jgi:hypothetical protein